MVVALACATGAGACSRREARERASGGAGAVGSADEAGGATSSSSGGATTTTTTATPPMVQPQPGQGATGRAGSASPEDDRAGGGAGDSIAQGCAADHDCACGVERTSGQCAVGLAARIDTSRQCPDFCGGFAGNLHTVCERGRCVQAAR